MGLSIKWHTILENLNIIKNMNDIKKKIDKLVKNADFLVASPESIEAMKLHGLSVESKFITYKEYLDKIFHEKRKLADSVVNKFPLLDKSIANATVQSLYEEVKECFVLGIPGACITLSSILLELSLKYCLFKERKKTDPNCKWSDLEKRNMSYVIKALFDKKIITKDETIDLNNFEIEVRNPYAHYNIEKLLKDMIIGKIPSINIETGEVIEHRNLKASEHPHLWFSGKRVLDKKTVISIVTFSIHWVNKILKN